MPEMTLTLNFSVEEEDAAAKIQAIKRGEEARSAAAVKKSKIWQRLNVNDAAGLQAEVEKAEANELARADATGTIPLRKALADAKYDCAKVLLAANGALGVPANELAVWERVVADKKYAAQEDAEEPADVNDPEYQKGLAESMLAGVDPTEAAYTVKAIVAIGMYIGGRADVDPEQYPNGKMFDLQVGAREGSGVSLAPNGDVYFGDYEAGDRSGAGALRTASGTTYVGQWKGGKRHGDGQMTYADGGVYKGSWAFGKRHGRGTFHYPSGDSYTGEWHAGAKHGKGRYKSAGSGCTYEGTWVHGVLAASKLTSSDGASYYGKFDPMGRPSGAGAFAFANGTTATGEYTTPPVDPEADADDAPVVPATWNGEGYGTVEATTDSMLSADLCTIKPVTNVVICGAPASGKGTQCEKIVEDFGLVHISTGDMLRAAANDPDDELGQQAAACMAEGNLVPDDLIVGLVSKRLAEPDCREKGWLLDGFPRTKAQAEKMEELFLVPTKAVLLDVPDEVLVERVTGRRNDPETGKIYHMTFSPPDGEDKEEVLARLVQRPDDTEEALRTRLVNFAANRDAVSAAFASCAADIDGNRDKDVVFEDIKKFLSR